MVGSGRRKYLPSTRTGVGSGKTLQYLHTQNNDMNKNTKTQDKMEWQTQTKVDAGSASLQSIKKQGNEQLNQTQAVLVINSIQFNSI